MTPLLRCRSMLFAPAVRPDFFPKLPGRGADLVVIDCEDATPAGAKADARLNVREHVPELIATGQPAVIRVNAVPTEWFADDIADGLVPGLAAIIVPKVESAGTLDVVAAALDAAGHPDLGVVVGLETVLGVAEGRPILAHPRVVGAYFGAEDYVADLGGIRTASNAEVAVPRAQAAIAARLAGVPVLDQVVTDFRDDARFEHECAEARAMGYAGKLCIHPGQVAIANRAFTPSDEELDRARRLLAAYDEASASGIAAIDFEGQMVDEPLAAQARHLLARATVRAD